MVTMIFAHMKEADDCLNQTINVCCTNTMYLTLL